MKINKFKKQFQLLESATQFLAEQLILKFKQLKEIKIIVNKKNALLKNKVRICCAQIELTLKWHTAFLGLGSNLGNKLENIKLAIKKLKNIQGVELVKTSKIKKTKAYGRKMDNFLNCVLKIKTFKSPLKLLQICNKIESDLKRERKIKWGPRTIDIDILFYDNLILTTDQLTIPHYDIPNREFVLNPMVELCPNFVHPILLKSMIELKKKLHSI